MATQVNLPRGYRVVSQRVEGGELVMTVRIAGWRMVLLVARAAWNILHESRVEARYEA